jgi:RNA polymerase sigma-70 factor (ECF subfamily)
LSERVREAMLDALPRVRRFALSLTGNREDADDLLQSTVERVLGRGLPEDADVLRWMFRVARNLWIDEVRSRKVRLVAADRREPEDEATVDGEDAAIGGVQMREIGDAMASLPEEQRALLSLVAIEGLTYREAAEVLEIPIGTVMSRLARARAGMAARLFGRGRKREAQ